MVTFVHRFHPSLPQIFQEVKKLITRLSSSRSLRPIFGETRFISSQTEPLSLGGLLQHSRFDERRVVPDGPKITKCGHRGCRCCPDILETSELYFRNSGITWQIKTTMNCAVRNVIYCVICKSCGYTYIGETVNLRNRMSTHRNNSKHEESAVMKVSKHLYQCGLGFWLCPIFKMRVENKIARLVKEDYLVKLLKPDLNADTRNLLHLDNDV